MAKTKEQADTLIREAFNNYGATGREKLSALRSALTTQEWPTPQPIETAPHGETVLVWNSIAREWAPSAHHRRSDTHWLPMPPPPGGGT